MLLLTSPSGAPDNLLEKPFFKTLFWKVVVAKGQKEGMFLMFPIILCLYWGKLSFQVTENIRN